MSEPSHVGPCPVCDLIFHLVLVYFEDIATQQRALHMLVANYHQMTASNLSPTILNKAIVYFTQFGAAYYIPSQ